MRCTKTNTYTISDTKKVMKYLQHINFILATFSLQEHNRFRTKEKSLSPVINNELKFLIIHH